MDKQDDKNVDRRNVQQLFKLLEKSIEKKSVEIEKFSSGTNRLFSMVRSVQLDSSMQCSRQFQFKEMEIIDRLFWNSSWKYKRQKQIERK
jgi:hypothetical protein